MVVLVAALLILPLEAQRRRFGFGFVPPSGSRVDYDGRFTIVRLWYPH